MPSYGAKGIAFTFDLGGERQFRRNFEGVVDDLTDFGPAFERIGETLRGHWFEVFVSEGAAAGEKWAPLSGTRENGQTGYAAWKARHYPGQTILTQSGGLARAMTFRNVVGNVTQIGRLSAAYGARRRTPKGEWDLGLIHHHGSTKRNIPARPIVNLPQKVKSQITRILRAHLKQEA